MMGILVAETCRGNKTAYFVASSWIFAFITLKDILGNQDVTQIEQFPVSNQTDLKRTDRRDWWREFGWPFAVSCSCSLAGKSTAGSARVTITWFEL
jgi:hypothetical protein